MYHVIRILSFLIGASLTTAAFTAENKPDVILLMTDQHRYDELSFLGTPGASTPAIDEICQEGVVFTHAFVPTPQCSPARASIFTGRWPHRAGVVGNVSKRRVPAGQSGPLDPAIPSMGKVFKDAGYETAYFGKWHLGESPEQCGFDTVGVSSGRAIALHISDFLQARNEEARKPLLMVVSWINPHDIYRINDDELAVNESIEARLPRSVDDDLATKPQPQAQFLSEDQGIPFVDYSHAQWLRYVRYYHQLTSKVDDDIGRVRATLNKSVPEAITIFTSDHGDLGGAHGLPYKCPAMYEELIRVPLVVSWPGKIQHKQSQQLVSSIDLLPTMCDLAKIPTPDGIDGQSLGPILDSDGTSQVDWRKEMFGEYYGKQNWRAPIRMIRTKKWKYCRYTSFGEELYDLENDPSELVNLAESHEYEHEKSKLANRLEEWMEATEDDFTTLTVTDRKGKLIKVK